METTEKETCIKEKRFLFWKFIKVEHDFHILSICKFMFVSEDFIVNYTCSRCGATYRDLFVKYDDLLLRGFTPETLNKITDMNWHYPQQKSNPNPQ